MEETRDITEDQNGPLGAMKHNQQTKKGINMRDQLWFYKLCFFLSHFYVLLSCAAVIVKKIIRQSPLLDHTAIYHSFDAIACHIENKIRELLR